MERTPLELAIDALWCYFRSRSHPDPAKVAILCLDIKQLSCSDSVTYDRFTQYVNCVRGKSRHKACILGDIRHIMSL
ncbi:hypothetical protein GEMRC1_013991 [Eukaryota sp. GEM-RC1]